MDVERGVEGGEREHSAAVPAHETGDAARPGRDAAPVTRDGRVGATTPARVLAMQRLAGNRAAAAALRAAAPRAAVQRETPAAGQLEVVTKEPPEEEKRPEGAVDDLKTAAAAAGDAAAGAGGSAGGDDGAAAAGAAAGAGAAAAAGAASGENPTDGMVGAGAHKALDVAKKEAARKEAAEVKPAAPVADVAKKEAARKEAAEVKPAASAAKAEKAAGVAKKEPPRSAPALPAKPQPATSKKAAAVKAPPAPPPAKRQPAKIAPPGESKIELRPAAPALPGTEQVAARIPDVPEEKSVQTQPLAVQRDPGGGSLVSDGRVNMGAPVWGTWTLDELFSVARTPLEVTRFVPGWGMLTGAVADTMGAVQDINAIPPGEYPLTENLMYLRSAVNIVNNATGHLIYVGELIQDGLAGSVVGAEFVPVSAAANETMAGVKVFLDGVLFYADLGVEIGALWNQSHSGPEQWEAWQGIVDGYQANLLGDIVGTILDVITLSSAGAANVDVAREGARATSVLGRLTKNWGSTLVTFLQGMFNVWGSKAPGVSGEQVPVGVRPPSKDAPNGPRRSTSVGDAAEAGLMRGAGTWLQTQAAQGRAAWEVVDLGIGLLQEEGARRMAELDTVVKAFSGGKGLWQVLQEGVLSGLAAMREKAASLQELTQLASDGKANGEQVQGWARDLLAQIDSFVVPPIEVPQAANYGDSLLADAAEFVADQASAVAVAALEALVAQVRDAVEDVKAELRAPVQAVHDEAVEIGEFLALVARVSGEQIGAIQGYIQRFETGFAQCTGFESAINLIIGQIAEFLGFEPFTVEDIRQYWRSLPQYFDSMQSLGGRLIAAAAQVELGTPVQTMPEEMAPPPAEPDDEDDRGRNSANV